MFDESWILGKRQALAISGLDEIGPKLRKWDKQGESEPRITFDHPVFVVLQKIAKFKNFANLENGRN